MIENLADGLAEQTMQEMAARRCESDKTAVEQAIVTADSAINALLSKTKFEAIEALHCLLDIDFTIEKDLKEAILFQRTANKYFDILKTLKQIIDDGDQASHELNATVDDDDPEEELRKQQHGQSTEQHYIDS